ncbi:MAG: amidohydrolase [Marinirhabdus sp.]|nr:amidohydrolase [Marinirhabdus sp.]
MNQEQLRITLLQSELHWEDPAANRAMFADKLSNLSGTTDLAILPEMFTTGFTMHASNLAENHMGPTVQWMQELANTQGLAITGSIIVKDQGRYYNRLYFVTENGDVSFYDKKHTFTLAGEHKTYKAGTEHLLVTYKSWRICPLICYDLRFPVWARNTSDYDLLLFVANWPKKRTAAWDALLKARAIENMAYCAGLNRVGFDGNGHEYIGHSAVYDVLGAQISTTDFEQEFRQTIVLEKSHIETQRKQLQFLEDRDAFTLG